MRKRSVGESSGRNESLPFSARQLRYFHIGVLCYVAAEYILWTSGCFRQGDLASFLYYGFDVLLTGCVFALLPATGRAVQA